MKRLTDIIRRNSSPILPLPTDLAPQLNKLHGIKAVLFDIYGTLIISGSGDVGTASAIDTAEAISQAMVVSGFEGDPELAGKVSKDMLKQEILAWHKAARETGVDFPEVEITKVWKKIIDSLSRTETLRPKASNIDQIREMVVEYECRVNPVYPMPECLQTLNSLKKRGFSLGIISNAQFYTPLIFSAFFEKSVEDIGFDPECCIWSYKELKAKPSKDLFTKAGLFLENKYGISLSETAFVGNDMLNDIYTAKNAGCKTVLFAGDKRSLRMRDTDDRCSDIQPDAIITSLDQLDKIL